MSIRERVIMSGRAIPARTETDENQAMSAVVESGAGSATNDRAARRNVIVLALAMAFGGAGGPINIAVSTLAGFALLGADKTLATLPASAFIIGTALGTLPAAHLMRRVGRRAGFISGLLFGSVGALLEAAAVGIGAFWLLCLGAVMFGMTNSFMHQIRFAAADLASERFRPKAISYVMTGGIAAAIIGPQAVIHTSGFLPSVPYAGAFVAAAGLLIIGAIIILAVDIPRPADRSSTPRGRPMGEIIRQPAFLVAVGCSMCAYSLMVLVMTAAPLAIVHAGHHQNIATLGIQWHVMAMFGPSFVTGSLISRFGAERIVATGLVILIDCALVALSGVTVLHFWAALILLGIGWNFGFIGGTTLVTKTYRPEEKERVQGMNDFLVFGVVAFSSLMAGLLLAYGGWKTVVIVVLPVSVITLIGLGWQTRKTRLAGGRPKQG